MQLTRRDAVRALGTTAVAGGLGIAVAEREHRALETTDRSVTTKTMRRLVAIANTIYPSQVEVTEGYVKAYVSRLPDERREATVASIDAIARAVERTGAEPLASASSATVDVTLRRMGVDRVDADPDGTVAERVRFYVTNSLLYLLFTTPKGSRLVGIDNPVGHPGGFRSYQEEP